MIGVLTELGRRMARGETAARNIARDMLSREALTAWLGRYPGLPVAAARNVLVIMAGNIPFVGMHDLVCVLAAGHRAIVKPSSRDRENMEWVVDQLLDIDPKLQLSTLPPSAKLSTKVDAVIAMGSDATIAAIAASHPGIPTLLRGNRSSLAVLTGRETRAELEGLADDVLMYSGLGCRSVSLLWVPRGYDFGPLGEVLRRREATLPDIWRGSLRQTRALMRMTATPHLDTGAALLIENRDFPSQPGVLNYTFYDDPAEVAEWIAEHDDEIQCVATTNFQLYLRRLYPPRRFAATCGPQSVKLSTFNFQLRATRLGSTQRPGLDDYPDGRDTMQFLTTI